MEDSFSFSLPVGGGGGTAFLLEGEGHITAVRAWERDGSYIYGSVAFSPGNFYFFFIVNDFAYDFTPLLCLACSIQLRFGYIWSKVAGRATGTRHEIELYPDERIIQVGACGSR